MRLWFMLLLTVFTLRSIAQDHNGLTIADSQLVTRADAFGVMQAYIEGTLRNDSAQAYTHLSVYAKVLDKDSAAVAEGFGYVVNACGAALQPDFALQPDQTVRFSVLLDVFSDDAALGGERVLTASGEAVPARGAPAPLPSGLLQVSTGEVVQAEWVDTETLRFGIGCDSLPFIALDWQQYSRADGMLEPIEHPAARYINERLLAAAELTEDGALEHSYIAMHPDSTRFVYQTPINTLYTIERDSQFRRLVADSLSRYSLHGILWLPNARFLAYYYGAYGDPVRFIVADMSGRRISSRIEVTPQSQTIPGGTPDGSAVVISGTFDGVSGYYLHSTTTALRALLFEAEPGENNLPAPIYREREAGLAYVYVVRELDGQTVLQCFDSETSALTDLVTLPFTLTLDERAWMTLNADTSTIAIYANGPQGGLWLYDLSAAPACR